jgi:hypothetical protein
MRPIAIAVAAMMAAGCGAPKDRAGAANGPDSTQRLQVPASAQPGASTPIITATTPERAPQVLADSVKRVRAADSARRAATTDSTKRAAAGKPADDRLRDSAFGPKFMVDSTGKVTPIKKKP